MSNVYTSIRLDIDSAKAEHDDLIGIKIDKSKCFDRLIPQQVAILFLAFGLPQTLVNGFLKIYKQLRRHLCFKEWCSPVPTSTSNGVAQGCSLSLLAINIVTMVWSQLIARLPNICAKAFIDDAYLWARVAHLQSLRDAWQVKGLWDEITGQKLNEGKSTLWATSTQSRTLASETFPNIPIKLEVEVLGATIYTSDRLACGFSQSKTLLIVADVKNIGALPLPRDCKSHLIGCKAIPRCTFGAGVSRMPKADVQKIQNEVATVLWDGRPHWRSRWLVLGFLGKPHRIEPLIARAYSTILDLFAFIEHSADNFAKARQSAGLLTKPKFALCNQFHDACAMLGLGFDGPSFSLSFAGSQAVPLQRLQKKTIKPLLQQLAIQTCYMWANSKTRKDFQRPTGVLDTDWSFRFRSKYRDHWTDDVLTNSIFDSVVVGCTLTLDRIKAAGGEEKDLCRLCGLARETLAHVISSCPTIDAQHGKVIDHELGPNFLLLGLCEHPYAIARHRLLMSPQPFMKHDSFCGNASVIRMWTDGSVVWPGNFWLKTAGYAIISEDGSTLEHGPVHHWHVTSFGTELWAVLRAISRAQQECVVYTDNQAVADGIAQITCGADPSTWLHAEWWLLIKETGVVHTRIHLWSFGFLHIALIRFLCR